jgi:hypothetical protein
VKLRRRNKKTPITRVLVVMWHYESEFMHFAFCILNGVPRTFKSRRIRKILRTDEQGGPRRHNPTAWTLNLIALEADWQSASSSLLLLRFSVSKFNLFVRPVSIFPALPGNRALEPHRGGGTHTDGAPSPISHPLWVVQSRKKRCSMANGLLRRRFPMRKNRRIFR